MRFQITLSFTVPPSSPLTLTLTKQNYAKNCLLGSHMRVLSVSYPMHTNMIRFRWFAKIFALEGLMMLILIIPLPYCRIRYSVCFVMKIIFIIEVITSRLTPTLTATPFCYSYTSISNIRNKGNVYIAYRRDDPTFRVAATVEGCLSSQLLP